MVFCVLLRVSDQGSVGWGGGGDKDMGPFYPGGVLPSGSCRLVREPENILGTSMKGFLAAHGMELAVGNGKDLT